MMSRKHVYTHTHTPAYMYILYSPSSIFPIFYKFDTQVAVLPKKKWLYSTRGKKNDYIASVILLYECNINITGWIWCLPAALVSVLRCGLFIYILYIYIYTNIYICIYIHIYIHTYMIAIEMWAVDVYIYNIHMGG
jgi:hypothetical protein